MMDLASLVFFVFVAALLFGVPLAVIAFVLYGAYSSFGSTKRKLPEDLPNDLFDGKPVNADANAADKAFTSEFKESFRASARKRFAAILKRVNAYFNIQKRY
ncbi:MAG: hypothetical protein ACKVP0_18835 [Pirellulaceae bacterium]